MIAPAEQLVSLVAPTSVEADQYRGLRHTIERMHKDAGLQVIAVTSPGAGEGKTVTTLNLAASLAQSTRSRVLVIDADLHRPSVGKYLGIALPHSPGLSDAIDDQLDLASAVRHLERFNLAVVLEGSTKPGTYELLNAPHVETLFKEARQLFDYVLVDTPPVVPLPDSRLLAQWVDGFLLVVAAHKTPRKALGEALNLLESARLLGTIFNGEDRPLSAYSSYYGSYAPRDDSARSGSGHGRWWRSRKNE